MPGDGTKREHEVAQLLRQLSIGLSAYRLFPDNLEQPGFVAASRRIVAAPSPPAPARTKIRTSSRNIGLIVARDPLRTAEGDGPAWVSLRRA